MQVFLLDERIEIAAEAFVLRLEQILNEFPTAVTGFNLWVWNAVLRRLKLWKKMSKDIVLPHLFPQPLSWQHGTRAHVLLVDCVSSTVNFASVNDATGLLTLSGWHGLCVFNLMMMTRTRRATDRATVSDFTVTSLT